MWEAGDFMSYPWMGEALDQFLLPIEVRPKWALEKEWQEFTGRSKKRSY
jgi:hypothetical protein